MTDSEKRQQKANLLLEIEEAESEFAALRERGLQAIELVDNIKHWLEKKINYSTWNSKFDIDDSHSLPIFDVAALKTIVSEMEQADEKRKELKKRRSDLYGEKV